MKWTKTIYDRFKKAVLRLTNSPNIHPFVDEYIFKQLPENEIARLITSNKSKLNELPAFSEGLLHNEAILLQTITILTLMETANNKKEFETLHKKRKQRLNKEQEQYQLTDFDKILKGIMLVPKPETEKKKKSK